MVAGNADTLQRVKWSVAYMRQQGTTLPVQVYHFPSERPADDDPIRQELDELAVQLVEATGQSKDAGKTKSYHLKALAVVQCPWREVLYLDSDSIPLRDPEYMFDSPSYLRTRFWATPDYWKTSANNPMWAILGIRCRNEWEMEAGQIFVDKKYHLDVFVSLASASYEFMLTRCSCLRNTCSNTTTGSSGSLTATRTSSDGHYSLCGNDGAYPADGWRLVHWRVTLVSTAKSLTDVKLSPLCSKRLVRPHNDPIRRLR